MGATACILLVAMVTSCSTAPSVPRPADPSQQVARGLDVCTFLPVDELAAIPLSSKGANPALGWDFSPANGCVVFSDGPSQPSFGLPDFTVSIESSPTDDGAWARILSDSQTRKVTGGWLWESPLHTLEAYSPKGYSFVINPRYGINSPDSRSQAIAISTVLLKHLDSTAPDQLPTITWASGNLLSLDICAAAEQIHFAQLAGGDQSAKVAAGDPGHRECSAGSLDAPLQFNIKAALSGGLSDPQHTATSFAVEGHQAQHLFTPKSSSSVSKCSVAVQYPDDPALTGHAPYYPSSKLTVLTTTITGRDESACPALITATTALVAELDKH